MRIKTKYVSLCLNGKVVCLHLILSWLGSGPKCGRFWWWTWDQSAANEPHPLSEDGDERCVCLSVSLSYTHTFTLSISLFNADYVPLLSSSLFYPVVPLIAVNSVCIVLLLLFGWRGASTDGINHLHHLKILQKHFFSSLTHTGSSSDYEWYLLMILDAFLDPRVNSPLELYN